MSRGIPIAATDPQGRFVYTTREVYRLTGHGEAKPRNLHWFPTASISFAPMIVPDSAGLYVHSVENGENTSFVTTYAVLSSGQITQTRFRRLLIPVFVLKVVAATPNAPARREEQ